MHENQEGYGLLPRRRKNKDESFKKCMKCTFYTNYYGIDFTSDVSNIYQYMFKLDPEVPQDSGLYHEAIHTIK